MVNQCTVAWERTGDSRWYIKHTNLSGTPDELGTWLKALLDKDFNAAG